MTTLREFVLERILEDESAAQRLIDRYPPDHRWQQRTSGDTSYATEVDPWRVLTGCVSKRLLVAAHRQAEQAGDVPGASGRGCSGCGERDGAAAEWPCYTLRVLALHWVDHPDYRAEWRPERLGRGTLRGVPAQAGKFVRPDVPGPRPAHSVA